MIIRFRESNRVENGSQGSSSKSPMKQVRCWPCTGCTRYALSGSALDEAVLLEALRPPVPRAVFDAAVAEVCEARRTKGRGGISSGMEVMMCICMLNGIEHE